MYFLSFWCETWGSSRFVYIHKHVNIFCIFSHDGLGKRPRQFYSSFYSWKYLRTDVRLSRSQTKEADCSLKNSCHTVCAREAKTKVITLRGKGCALRACKQCVHILHVLHNNCTVRQWMFTIQCIISSNGQHGNEELNLALCLVFAYGHGQFVPTWLDHKDIPRLCSSKVWSERERERKHVTWWLLTDGWRLQ